MLPHAAAIFLSAFLLFQVQPLAGKELLPWFGGSAAVWSACLLFFQAVLFLGYLYAHLLGTRLAPRRQGIVHLALLAVALAFLPLAAGAAWKPPTSRCPSRGSWRSSPRRSACPTSCSRRTGRCSSAGTRCARPAPRGGCTRSRTPVRCSGCSPTRSSSSRSCRSAPSGCSGRPGICCSRRPPPRAPPDSSAPRRRCRPCRPGCRKPPRFPFARGQRRDGPEPGHRRRVDGSRPGPLAQRVAADGRDDALPVPARRRHPAALDSAARALPGEFHRRLRRRSLVPARADDPAAGRGHPRRDRDALPRLPHRPSRAHRPPARAPLRRLPGAARRDGAPQAGAAAAHRVLPAALGGRGARDGVRDLPRAGALRGVLGVPRRARRLLGAGAGRVAARTRARRRCPGGRRPRSSPASPACWPSSSRCAGTRSSSWRRRCTPSATSTGRCRSSSATRTIRAGTVSS